MQDFRPVTITADPDLVDAIDTALGTVGLYLAREPDEPRRFRVRELPVFLRRKTDPQPTHMEIQQQ